MLKNNELLKCEMNIWDNKLPSYLNYLQMSTSEVERSFSMLHKMVNKHRTNLTDSNVEKMMVVKHFYKQ